MLFSAREGSKGGEQEQVTGISNPNAEINPRSPPLAQLWIKAAAAPRRSHPVSGVEELGQGSRREIYLWDSGKGWENLGEVLKPRSGVTPGSGIYLEQDNVSDRREKNKKSVEEVQIRPLGWELLDDPSQGTDSWISLISPFK